jgi:flagellar biosynthesis protein FliP
MIKANSLIHRAGHAAGHRRRLTCLGIAWLCLVATVVTADAQMLNFDGALGPQQGATWARITQLGLLITGLSVAPGVLMMVTCFPRFLIVFSFLRAGLGLPSTPSNVVLVGLALFMTLFVMAPTFDRAWTDGLQPLGENRIKPEEAVVRMAAPFKAFMLANTRAADLQLFRTLAAERLKVSDTAATDDLRVIVPAFMTSELRRGFEIGFLVILPFLVIDLVVATVVMSMGMMMLSPLIISLPFKIMLFVLVDGWALIVGTLATSFYT